MGGRWVVEEVEVEAEAEALGEIERARACEGDQPRNLALSTLSCSPPCPVAYMHLFVCCLQADRENCM